MPATRSKKQKQSAKATQPVDKPQNVTEPTLTQSLASIMNENAQRQTGSAQCQNSKDNESETPDLRTAMTELSEVVQTMLLKYGQLLESIQNLPTWNGVMQKIDEKIGECLVKEIQDATRNATAEYHEQKKRSKNIIISNMPENSSIPTFDDDESNSDYTTDEESGTDRDEESVSIPAVPSLEKVTVLCRLNEVVKVKESDIVHICRLGPKTSTPRKLKIELRTESLKRAIIKNNKLVNQKHLAENHVYISPDLTQKQRTADFQLRQQLRQQRAEGKDVIIRHGCIITRPT